MKAEALPHPLDKMKVPGKYVVCQKGEVLKKQFSRVDQFYILLKGSVHFHQTLQSKNQVLLAGMSHSQFAPIGLDAFIAPFRNETTAVVASDQAELLCWESKSLIAYLESDFEIGVAFFHFLNLQSHRFVGDTSQLFANTSAALLGSMPENSSDGYLSYLEQDEVDKVILLLQSPFFEIFDEKDLAFLVQHMERREYLKGDIVIRQDEVKKGIYILESGEVQYSRMNYSMETNQNYKIPYRAISTSGYLLGSASLMGAPSAITSYVSKDAVVIYIPGKSLDEICKRNKAFALKFEQRILWLINNQLRAVRTRLITTQFNEELLVAATLLGSNSAKLSVHSPLHIVPELLENKLTIPHAFEILHEVELKGKGPEKNLASLCLDNLHKTQKEMSFYNALKNVYSSVAESQIDKKDEEVQLDCILATRAAFSIPSLFVKGFENFPSKSGCIFIYNHLLNDPYYTLPNQFQITLDSHYLGYLLYEQYEQQALRVVRIGKSEEYGHENYYERLGFIDVYTKDSDARIESEAEKKIRQNSFFNEIDQAIKSGKNIIISPEGTSNSTENSPTLFKSGIFKVIKKMAHEPWIVPIVMSNFDKRITTHKYACEIKEPFKLSDKMAMSGLSDIKEFLKGYHNEFKADIQKLSREIALENSAQYLFEEEVKALKQKVEKGKTSNISAFFGSSTLRLWETLEEDLPEKRPVNFAFGGSTYSWCLHYFDLLFEKMKPSSFILYGGDNDLSNGDSPNDVLNTLTELVAKIRLHSPNVPISIISIKPSPSRDYIMAEIVHTNQLLKKFAESNDNMFWIETYDYMLTDDGKPRTDLFMDDMLHLNSKGYDIWKKEVARQLL
ncbi:MAG: cyclic nucleotide-binding domain-containing protein [Reichenbachiella sp.]